ncbi:hypothetical protein NUW54_g7149 [Trametes sanguinea]|uniref:Uncharacterized protein n=1 Tax=Trametes sanguinea TaxID=158606 RepID=A0ACC1PQ95_9APHY|nr:hypothetical protein NUW54_g7149 [Trametes sanguinea]
MLESERTESVSPDSWNIVSKADLSFVNTEDSGESDTIGADKRSTLHSTADDAAVVKTSTFPKRSEFEPSTVSYNGSVLLDDFGKPVFYAM